MVIHEGKQSLGMRWIARTDLTHISCLLQYRETNNYVAYRGRLHREQTHIEEGCLCNLKACEIV